MRPQRLEVVRGDVAWGIDRKGQGGDVRFHISPTLVGIVGMTVVTACGSLPAQYVKQAEPGVTLTGLTASPEAYRGKTVILGGVVVDQKQEGQRLWLYVRNRPLDKDYRPHRPNATTGPEAGHYWVMVQNSSTLPPKWKQWARVTVVGRVADPPQGGSPIGGATEPVLTLLFMRGWTMGQAQQGSAWEESVDANYLLSVPEGLHGE